MRKLLIFMLLAFVLNSGMVMARDATPTTVIPPQQEAANYQGEIYAVENQSQGQIVKVKITDGDLEGVLVEINTATAVTGNTVIYKKGDKVFLTSSTNPSTETEQFFITGFNRTNALIGLFIVFIIVVLIISKRSGFTSLIGMAYSFLVIFKFMIPQLLAGNNPLLIAILGALFIAPVTFYLSHGLNKKTTVALIATLITLFITGLLSMIFINVSKLTGFGSEEAFFLQINQTGLVNVKGLLLAGIIIGALGILDDITVSQAAIVFQLKKSVPQITNIDLFKKAMEIGHDHIASTVNTLVLVYAGAALPLLLLFFNSSQTLLSAINQETIADEIVRTLVSSIGLVLAVPICTTLSVFFAGNNRTSK